MNINYLDLGEDFALTVGVILFNAHSKAIDWYLSSVLIEIWKLLGVFFMHI